ncbi:MAG: hypothetical protein U1F35_20970 [Steroidobacteraceae bacterium]
MALHQAIQRVLLIGAKLDLPPPPAEAPAPAALQPLIDAIAPRHRAFDERAVHFGHRYRSGFWAIYLLSALAVLCAVLPLALGWDNPRHGYHPLAGYWALAEVALILTVAAIYWLGHHRDWQGQWLAARTTAELSWYLPLVAPLVDFECSGEEAGDDIDWYARVFDPGQHLRGSADLEALCRKMEPLARDCVRRAWAQAGFPREYAQWTLGLLLAQQHYHRRVGVHNRALQHRVHRLNGGLFGLTAVGALAHLALHTLWLSLVTTFFPALGASLHGALAQSESYRLGQSAERLVNDLGAAADRIRSAIALQGTEAPAGAIRDAIEAALAIILEEHQDWHLLVLPHHLPLA